MITSTNTSTHDVWTYSYNFRNLMTGAVEKTSGGTILEQVTLTYDALDNRIGMDENGTQTWTLYDGSTPIMDFNSSGSLEMRYLNGPTGDLVDTVIARESASGTVAWYLPDRLGTIRDLVNNSGSTIDHVDYSAFGTVLDESDPSEGDRMMGFAGMERDTVTGLNLAVYRVQNPGTGRWTSQDPLGFVAGDVDLYRYSFNSPADLTDASGLDIYLYPGPVIGGHSHVSIVVYDPVTQTGVKYDGAGPGGLSANGGGPSGTGGAKKLTPKEECFKGDPDKLFGGAPKQLGLKGGVKIDPGPKLPTYAKQKAALHRAFCSTPQVQSYNALYGPNSNTYANALLIKIGIIVPYIENPATGNLISIPGWSNTAPYFPKK